MTKYTIRARSSFAAFALGFVFALMHPSIGNAALIQVDSSLGTTDANSCTLTNAFGAASVKVPVGTCVAGDGNDVIELPAAASITLIGQSARYGGSLLPIVTGTLLVVGNGAIVSSEFSTCDDTTTGHRLISIANTAALYINDLTLENGCANDTYDGGAILAFGSLDVENVTFANNLSTWNGGAIGATGPLLHISNSSFSSNGSGAYGGAVYAAGTDATISGSFFSGNTAASDGGALWLGPFDFKVVNSTFTKNAAAVGGAIEAGAGSISFSTFAGNNATNGGAAIWGSGAGTLVGNNIFAKSPGGDSGETFNCGDASNATTFVYTNISDDASCGNALVVASEFALKFGVPGLHGGTTQTIPLGDGSVAINAATPCNDADGASENLDQRGVQRNFGTCDAGAFQHDGDVYPIAIPAPLGAGNLLISNGSYVSEYSRDGDHIRDFWPPLQPPPLPSFPEAVDADGLTSFGTFLNGYNGNAVGLYAIQQDTWDKRVYPAWTDYDTQGANQIAHVGNRWFFTAQISNVESGLLVIENDQQIGLIHLGQAIGDLKAGLDGYLYLLLGSTIEKFDTQALQSVGSIDIYAGLDGNQARSIAVASASELFVYRSDGMLTKLDANGSVVASTDCVVAGNAVPCSDIREIALSQDHKVFLMPNLYFGPPVTATVTMIDDTFTAGSSFSIDITFGGGDGPPKLVVSPVVPDAIFGSGFEP